MDRESGRTPHRCRDAPHPPPYRASTSEAELLFDSKQMQPEQSLCFGLRRYSHQLVSGAIQQVQAVSDDMLEPANQRFVTRRINGLRLLGAGSGDRKIQAGQAASSIARSLSDRPFGDRVTPPTVVFGASIAVPKPSIKPQMSAARKSSFISAAFSVTATSTSTSRESSGHSSTKYENPRTHPRKRHNASRRRRL